MVNVDQAVIARIKKEGKVFEILVDCDKALELRRGKPVGIDDVLAADIIFKDAKKGDKASEHDLQNIFKTIDARDIALKIIKEGDVQLTAKHRAKEQEEKRKRIIEIIHRNAIDPQTGLPHPPQRIDNAMNEAKVRVDEYKSAEAQIEEVLSKLKPIIPIKFETRELQVVIPAQYSGLCYGFLKKHKLLKDEWQNDGSLMALVEIPAGVSEEFENGINKMTHGEADIKIIGRK
ncbi:ribosome assembly factor SBDS [Candidatus Woesearchaeota archaeon]|nr:ribosome assembly factor SBDS [Candidatus Woesearchaeota archaeon]